MSVRLESVPTGDSPPVLPPVVVEPPSGRSKPSPKLNSFDVLGPSGLLSKAMEGYEARAPQLRMADAVAQTIASGGLAMIEAGTGTGKSLAYLVPAIIHATKRRKKVVVSTATKNLQEQLVTKDLPLLEEVLPRPFKYRKFMGRSNYLSKRRAENALSDGGHLFPTDDLEYVTSLISRFDSLEDGTFDELEVQPSRAVKEASESDSHDCKGKDCRSFKDCFFYQARNKMLNADVIVANHALVLTDAVLKSKGAPGILPVADLLIIDEAHTFAEIARGLLGVVVSHSQIDYLLKRLFVEGKKGDHKGLLADRSYARLHDHIRDVKFVSDHFFFNLHTWLSLEASGNGRVHSPVKHPEAHKIVEALDKLAELLVCEVSTDSDLAMEAVFSDGPLPKKRNKHAGDDEERSDFADLDLKLMKAAGRAHELANNIETWLDHAIEEDAVYWVEKSFRTGAYTIKAAPIEVARSLKNLLWENRRAVVLSSATLSIGSPPSFEYHKRQLGIDRCTTLKLESPFDYKNNVVIHAPRDFPDPSASPGEFEEAVIWRALPFYLGMSKGRAFVLFTADDMMRRAAAALRPWLARQGFPLVVQGELPRERMIVEFKSRPNSVLFGVDSFWQGVDVRGEALSNVIIVRLPFRVPNTPLAQAREQAVKARRGNPFMELSIPETGLKFKQGFGRLIRSATDRGIVVVLDPRIRTKPYGNTFLKSLPYCPMVVDDLPQRVCV
jgi:ATP-dependent DNA helicase DinG